MTGLPRCLIPGSKETQTCLKSKILSDLAEEGIYFHPHHNWFVGNAHDSKSIEQALCVADRALEQWFARKTTSRTFREEVIRKPLVRFAFKIASSISKSSFGADPAKSSSLSSNGAPGVIFGRTVNAKSPRKLAMSGSANRAQVIALFTVTSILLWETMP